MLLLMLCNRWRESKGMVPPPLAGPCLQPLHVEAATHEAGGVLWDICAAVTTVLLFPLWHRIPEMAWPEACVSLATSCGWVGADMLFSVYVSKSSWWDAVPAGFSKRVRAVQPRAAGRLPGFEKVFEASRLCRAPRPCSLSHPDSPA